MDYCDTGCMLGRAPQTKETLPDFCENMDPDKWDTIVWYRVTKNPHKFSGLTGCQRDPRIWGVTNKYSSHYIIKFIGFMSIYYVINLDIVSSCMIFSNLYISWIYSIYCEF